MYFMTSPATAMTMALEMMDEANRQGHRSRPLRPTRRERRILRREAASTNPVETRRTWRLVRTGHVAH